MGMNLAKEVEPFPCRVKVVTWQMTSFRIWTSAEPQLKCLDLQKSSVSLQGKGAKLLEGMKAAAAFLTAHKLTEDVRRLGVGGSHSFYRMAGDWALRGLSTV